MPYMKQFSNVLLLYVASGGRVKFRPGQFKSSGEKTGGSAFNQFFDTVFHSLTVVDPPE